MGRVGWLLWSMMLIAMFAGCRQVNLDITLESEEEQLIVDVVNDRIIIDEEYIQDETEQMESTIEVSEDVMGDPVRELLNNMTIEEKIGQMFYLSVDSMGGAGTGYTQVNEEIVACLGQYKPGGIILFQENIISREQVVALTAGLLSESIVMPFIGVDEEGGAVQRIGNNSEIYTEAIGPMLDIGQSGDLTEAYYTGELLGDRLSELGFSMDFAPVADVLTNPYNTEIGNRSFCSDPEIVADMVSEVIRGMQEYKICTTLKHFPGHGHAETDSHYGSASTSRTKIEMENCEFIPFQAGIAAGTDFILISHIIATELSDEQVPSTLSEAVITHILREELGFDGVIITDAMNMGAITEHYSSADAALKSVQAGADMILMPANISGAWQSLYNAVADGILPESRIDESVYRILKVKEEKEIIQINSLED